jgi:hypothetical protein
MHRSTKSKRASPEKYLLRQFRYQAKKKGLPFSLTLSDIKIPAYCPVLGLPLSFEGHQDYSPSVDRIIPRLGYIPKNIIVVSFRANRLKSDGQPWEHFDIHKFYAWLEIERGL